METVLEIRGLKTYFETRRGVVRAVDGVDLSVRRGDTVGIVGESGCGKTVLALSIMKLLPSPPGRIVAGEILFMGRDLASLSIDEMRKIRGRDISMIFQEPMNSLNPVLTIGDQIVETIALHRNIPADERSSQAIAMLNLVGIPSPADRLRSYPHQMSGGMRQRVMIAMALACGPKIMLADEPTTALDVTIQAQILDLIIDLKRESGASVILITHDLGVIAEAAQHVAVMYTGKIVEYAPVADLFDFPLHPYTIGLMASQPRFAGATGPAGRLKTIPGTVPDLYQLPQGCTFQDRCTYARALCRNEAPELKASRPGHSVSCWNYA